jgi:hypothetical protein
MYAGKEIVFIYGGKLMKGILWERGLLDYGVKSPNITGIAYIKHEQVLTEGVTKDALEYLLK